MMSQMIMPGSSMPEAGRGRRERGDDVADDNAWVVDANCG